MIRRATAADLHALVLLEASCFQDDRISRSSYRRLLQRESALILVDEADNRIRGSAVLLFRHGLSIARLYSIAVYPEYRGLGLGRNLIQESIKQTAAKQRLALRLEVRDDNKEAIALYEKLGFRLIGRTNDYYEDGTAALKYQHSIVPHREPVRTLYVPYYAQTLDFTCGAACLAMALAYYFPEKKIDSELEIDIWREANTVYMASGIGGCSAEGLATTAMSRGLQAEVFVSDRRIPFVNSVRTEKKKKILHLVHDSFRRKLELSGHPVVQKNFDRKDITDAVDQNKIPILLVSGYRLFGKKEPHWVVVTGYDEHFIYIHDPYTLSEIPETDGRHLPIHERDFYRISRYGNYRSMVLVFR